MVRWNKEVSNWWILPPLLFIFLAVVGGTVFVNRHVNPSQQQYEGGPHATLIAVGFAAAGALLITVKVAASRRTQIIVGLVGLGAILIFRILGWHF